MRPGFEGSSIRRALTNPPYCRVLVRATICGPVLGGALSCESMDDSGVDAVSDTAGGTVMVELVTHPENSDFVSDWLWGAGASAVVESIRSDGSVELTADLSAEMGLQDLPDGLAISARIVATSADDRALGQTWRDFVEPVRCGRILVVPTWRADLPADADSPDPLRGVTLYMEPGEAFGAGTHVTTRLCLEAVSDLVGGAESLLDFGCGTGILGVGAAMLGASRVVALDIDPEAVRVTRDLAALNGVSEVVAVTDDPLTRISGPFDLVFANVLIGVIEEFGPSLVELLAPGGRLVMSGVIESQRERVTAALAPLVIDNDVEVDGWLRLTFGDPSDAARGD